MVSKGIVHKHLSTIPIALETVVFRILPWEVRRFIKSELSIDLNVIEYNNDIKSLDDRNS